jgi:DnaJ-domain-containing protein 1
LDRFVDYYAVLDVPRNATQKEISKAYKRLTKVFDPEINEDMFRLVNEAYQVLSDPAKRAEYDARYDAIAQAQEELTEPEEALALLCKAIMEHLFGLLDLYELADDCAVTLNEARGSPIRPEVRRLALEVAEVAEKDWLMALALLVKLYLSEAKPREPEVAVGAGRRKRVDVYIDLLRLLMPAPSANPPERSSSEGVPDVMVSLRLGDLKAVSEVRRNDGLRKTDENDVKALRQIFLGRPDLFQPLCASPLELEVRAPTELWVEMAGIKKAAKNTQSTVDDPLAVETRRTL